MPIISSLKKLNTFLSSITKDFGLVVTLVVAGVFTFTVAYTNQISDIQKLKVESVEQREINKELITSIRELNTNLVRLNEKIVYLDKQVDKRKVD
jgi:C4-dicarboxylate transporter